MKTIALLLISGLLASNEVAHAQSGALKYGNSAASKYCEAREQRRSHSNALQLAMMDGTARSSQYSARQGSIESQNAQVNFNSYVDTMCPQYLQDFGDSGLQSTNPATGQSCFSSLDIYMGVQTGVISKRCANGSIHIKVHR